MKGREEIMGFVSKRIGRENNFLVIFFVTMGDGREKCFRFVWELGMEIYVLTRYVPIWTI